MFLAGFQTANQKPDNLTTEHVWTIQIPDLSCIQMVTVFKFLEWHRLFRINKQDISYADPTNTAVKNTKTKLKCKISHS